MHAQNDLMEGSAKEQRASKAIAELQDEVTTALNDRKDLEIEFIALKKNFYNLRTDLDKEKVKNESMSVELINLVNENKVVQRDMQINERNTDQVNQNKMYHE